MASFDSRGNLLDGGKDYKLRLPPNIPANHFWSVTTYDTHLRSMIQTNQQFPVVPHPGGDEALVNPDGSVDLYFAPKAPAGKERNWTQTIPRGGWFPLLRLYGPLDPWFDKTWRPGEIELVK